MDRITFSKNWNNKLYCDFFSTIRLRNDVRFQVGKTFEAVLRDDEKDVFVKYVKIYSIHHTTLENLTEGMSLIDTGMSKEKTIGMFHIMYKNKDVDLNTAEFTHLILGTI